MRELFKLSEKYGFKAPLASVTPDFNFTTFTRLCNSLNVSPITTAIASELFVELQNIEELTASLDHLAVKTDRKISNLRHHLSLLEKQGLVTTEFITTDPIKKRRGKLFTLTIPKGNMLAAIKDNSTPQDKRMATVPATSVEAINVEQYEHKARYMELQIVRYLVKAMRTNRKDTVAKLSVEIRDSFIEKPIKITARAEQGRLIYLPDMSYYAACVTWLITHIQEQLESDEQIGETFTLPLEPIIALSKDIDVTAASAGGYINNAIAALQRISATTFDMQNFFNQVFPSIIDIEMFYKLFRLEAIVTYKDERGQEKKAAVLQFPRSTILNLVAAIKSQNSLQELLLFSTDVFATNNEIEILFGLWARSHLFTGKQADKIYTWNALREHVAPSSTLNEFKRKFSSLIIANADPTYIAKIHESIKDRITETIGTIHLSGNRKGERIVEYGRATIQGYLINIGYSEEHGSPVLAFRRDMSGLTLKHQIGYNL